MKNVFIAVLLLCVASISPAIAAPPPALKAQVTGGKSVALTWTDAINPAGTTYNVYRETSVGGCTNTSVGTGPGCLKLNSTPIAGLAFSDVTTPFGNSWYVIRAFDGTTESVNSNEVTVFLPKPPPAAPVAGTPKVQ